MSLPLFVVRLRHMPDAAHAIIETDMLPRPARFREPLCNSVPVPTRFHTEKLSLIFKNGIRFRILFVGIRSPRSQRARVL